MLSLVMNPGAPDEQMFALPVGSVTIGRTKDNAIFCLHKSLSRRHAQIDSDGLTARLTDLGSKNGVFFNGKKVGGCELGDGDTFRCGDVSFLVEGGTRRIAQKGAGTAQTLPSPLAMEAIVSRRGSTQNVSTAAEDESTRYKDKLFALIRASELLASTVTTERLLDELVVLAAQVLEVDRIALLTIDKPRRPLRERVVKTFLGGSRAPYSRRIVEWVVAQGSPASFADLARDRTLPGDPSEDAGIRAAVCVPIDAGSGPIGVIYADSLSAADIFRADDLAFMRALANLAAVGLDDD